MYIFSIFVEINYFWMLYALCDKVHNFGTCKHHGTRFLKSFVCETNLFYVNHF
jgi:hypothetical protein